MTIPQFNVEIDGEPAQPRLRQSILRVEMQEGDLEPSVASLRLQLAQRSSGSFFPIDDDILVAGTSVAIDVAAPGGRPQRLFDGLVTHVRPHFEGIESNCYVEILCMDAAVVLDAFERTTSYLDSSDSDAAAAILSRYNIRAEVEATTERHRADHQLLVQRATDWDFLRYLARRNGYVCYFEHDDATDETVGHFRRRPLNGDPQPDLTILQGDANLKWLDLQWNVASPQRWIGQAIDPIRKRLITSNGASEREVLGEDGLGEATEQALIDRGAEGATRLLRSARPTDQGLSAHSAGATDEARFSIEARGEVDPRLYRGLLRARRTVLIKGPGGRMSGVYYVRGVKTIIDAGEISQQFTAERNALGQTGAEEFGQSAEEIPPQ